MPTTPNYGWTYPSSSGYVKNGASDMQTIATGVDTTLGTALNNKTRSGLVLITSQTIGSGVSTVSLNSVFSTNFKSYRIIYSPDASSLTGTVTYMRFRTGSTDNSTSNYSWAGNQVTYTNSASTAANSSQNLGFIGYGSYTSPASWGTYVLDIFNPFLSQYTLWESAGTGVQSGGVLTRTTFGGYFNANTSFDGITFFPIAGTLTGGTIAVYGYAKD